MALVYGSDALDMIISGVELAVYDDEAPARLRALSRRIGRRIPIHFYIDTGISRVGMPYHRALGWMQQIASSGSADIRGTMMAFTENEQFDAEQLGRFRELI